MSEQYDLLLKPIISEKSHTAIEDRKYTFKVAPRATKVEIVKAVKSAFEVDVEKVNIIKMKPKPKRLGRFVGKKPGWKKAVVTLKQGQKIPGFFEGM